MGLAAPKRRNKLSQDPNNNEWSKSADSYGQKILSAQGWKPGDYLGARDATHTEHYTAANKAHIKILLREDNLGVGAQVGKSNAETFGLSLYSGVLSRLNGKTHAEVEKQQSAMRDAELRTFQANKYGFMNFVSGGVLVGDSIERVTSGQPEASEKSSRDSSKRGAKRQKLSSSADDEHGIHKTAKSVLNTGESSAESNPIETELVNAQPAERKSKKKQKEHRNKEKMEAGLELDKRILKQQKRARKEEHRKRKEEKRQAKAENDASLAESDPPQQSSEEARPALIRPTVSGSRHAVRQRYIHQKRMASLDPQAMKEIFMQA